MTSRNEYQRLAEARLEEISARIDLLKAQTRQADAKARIEIDRQVASLQKQKAAVRRNLAEMKEAGENAFLELKAGMDMALADMKTALEEAAAKFKRS